MYCCEPSDSCKTITKLKNISYILFYHHGTVLCTENNSITGKYHRKRR